MQQPLAITHDQELLDDLLRMAAAAGVELDVARSAAQARPYWNHAPLVIVGGDIAGDLAAAGLPHRDRVLIVTRETADVDTWRTCVALGAQAVWELPEAERILVEELGEAADPPTRAGDVVCVVGGKGGAGATVLAAALAVTASRAGLRTLLIDADPLGGGIDVVLGQEEATGARWPDFVGREGRVGFAALQDALPTFGELTVLSWHRGEPAEIPRQAMRAVLDAGRRGCDLVVVDLPRHLGEGGEEALPRAARTLLVVPAEVRGALAAAQTLAVLRRHTSELYAVLRQGSLDPDVVGASLDIPCAGVLPELSGLTETLDRGDPLPLGRAPLGGFCTTLLRTLMEAR
ncbi:septum formation initiator [Thermobispora bispora]|jgi:secretion/DNA translocation related CpaE-like protein|uniref:septum site-determining protein Ssd n=1 Tax=Thermobispora bispora TaxID=2006 RepID=UPI00197E7214|nr:septum site-determining protein Ssd [Thermobispora bispora]MBO2474509.1 chromosome partitioning protein [Actinomycetales bacterium]MDI9579289.1 CpaE-like family protein [Thermobispora sp.]QSI46928.1 chromosome partitioning protein [Thermobispora bispora]